MQYPRSGCIPCPSPIDTIPIIMVTFIATPIPAIAIFQAMGAAAASFLINISRQGLIYIPALFLLRQLMGVIPIPSTERQTPSPAVNSESPMLRLELPRRK